MQINLRLSFSGLLIVAALTTAAIFKPEKSTFQAFFNQWLREKMKEQRGSSRNSQGPLEAIGNFLQSFSESAFAEVFSRVVEKNYKDCGLFSVITVEVDGQDLAFMGIYGRWFFLPIN
eukprot:TRINITY_DN1199_c0_g1_i1.p1 TRINITY_DN1199_c0_g1~~TRINITY_DN1199_c0_g1_i1.p1  ORF type:complete len:118 (-),score=8.04 TRINITY_DN1199_c0_g1_i1:18-371(-)